MHLVQVHRALNLTFEAIGKGYNTVSISLQL
jgi:hypothetical protein